MKQGSVVAIACDSEILVWGHGLGIGRGNSERHASGPAPKSSELGLKSFETPAAFYGE